MDFSHLNASGYARMVDVSHKEDTDRTAVARAVVTMQPETRDAIQNGVIQKGDVLAVAQVAGVMGAKQTWQLIPMCHPLMITSVDIQFIYPAEKDKLIIQATVKTSGKTGVEMEAMTAVSVAALTIYDMCKAVDRWMDISEIRLQEKSGGKSGHVKYPG